MDVSAVMMVEYAGTLNKDKYDPMSNCTFGLHLDLEKVQRHKYKCDLCPKRGRFKFRRYRCLDYIQKVVCGDCRPIGAIGADLKEEMLALEQEERDEEQRQFLMEHMNALELSKSDNDGRE
jgi:hypothetical protein